MPTSPIDLTTVSAVKNWPNVAGSGTQDDANIQACITALSFEFLKRTGYGPQDQTVPDASPFVAPVEYREWYDGSGSNRQFLRNRPIVSVNSVQVNGIVIPLSTDHISPGFVIDGDGKALSIVGTGPSNTATRFPGGYAPPASTYALNFYTSGYYWFAEGTQNVFVDYVAGYSATPPDIELAVRKWVYLNSVRRKWTGLKSESQGLGSGQTTSYTSVEMSDDIMAVIGNYYRRALV